ncbi:alpha/beta hydrolase [Asticcacaulis sp. EMRT-3]|uniref:alpha/beta hydrolase n=1 Tax=Asticcacaulis sp. EMRT-3 TaxID=3040349 RepID=UPI0024AFDEE4|nr:alpha/beta hydrolase [Asticcacaulis sp. EMRT-3]MDI7776405.1 alpha/beta hydrolase [Asticcacaulis sp. EMRT-3]
MRPDEVTILSSGGPNRLTGEWPDRKLEAVSRAELWSFRAEKPRAQALICAGGGYLQLMTDREGVEVALWLQAQGFDAHVLIHRLPGADDGQGGVWPSDIALQDGLQAVQRLGDVLPLFLMGLSSGGHLAGALACQSQVKAAGVVIAYAPINANHRDYKAPKGKPDYPPPEKQAFYDAWPIGISSEPHGLPSCPVFLAYALHDTSVPVEHALNFIGSARDKGLDLDAHIFGKAPHGFALRERDGSHAIWPDLALDWMRRQV